MSFANNNIWKEYFLPNLSGRDIKYASLSKNILAYRVYYVCLAPSRNNWYRYALQWETVGRKHFPSILDLLCSVSVQPLTPVFPNLFEFWDDLATKIEVETLKFQSFMLILKLRSCIFWPGYRLTFGDYIGPKIIIEK